jgi:hypothetical protein
VPGRPDHRVHAAPGIDTAKELHDGPRFAPITDGGKPVRALFE